MKSGHLYFQWPRSILYNKHNKQELLRAHAALYHPSPERLFNLIKVAEPD
jgi:hypothetical protein